jgi:RNA polymerase sigma factor (sigma-70 family)
LIAILQPMLAQLHDQHVVLSGPGTTVRTYVPTDFIDRNGCGFDSHQALVSRHLAFQKYPLPSSVYNRRSRNAASLEGMALEQDQRIAEVVKREQSRLRNFIRRRVRDRRDAEDILQDVFYELVEANRLLMPIDHITGWLFRVARNRIIDLFRKKKPERFSEAALPRESDENDELLRLEDLLPSPDAGPEALYARQVLLDELELAVDQLPREQREVFVAHELEGRSFKEAMTPEERERFRQRMRERCGVDPSTSEAKGQ